MILDCSLAGRARGLIWTQETTIVANGAASTALDAAEGQPPTEPFGPSLIISVLY